MSTDATYEAVFAHAGPWTEDDYFALPDVPARVELVDGALLVTPLSSLAHQRLIYEVTHLLRETCTDRRWEALPGANVRLWQDHIRAPDALVVRADLDVLKVAVRDVLVLVEITSPGNFRQDMIVKHGDYAEAGVPFYLRIDLHKGIDELTASAYELVDGSYREYATAPDGLLRLHRPWLLEADLRALARGRGR
jgi:Uma2 family endonuclease